MSEKGKFNCEFCSKTFTTKRRFEYHVDNACPKIFDEKEKLSCCQFCSKEYKESWMVRRHMKTCKFNNTTDENIEISEKMKITKTNITENNIITKEYTKKQKRNVNGFLSKRVASGQDWKCQICNQKLDETYEIDHIIPLFKGGSNDRENLQALCPNCHKKKTIDDLLYNIAD